MTHLDQLEQTLEAVEYGTVEITLQRHQGKTASMEIKTKHASKFDANQAAITFLLQLIGTRVDSGFSGDDTLQLSYHQGKLTKIFQHVKHKVDAS